jgi:hypothetical protein
MERRETAEQFSCCRPAAGNFNLEFRNKKKEPSFGASFFFLTFNLQSDF